MSDEVQCWKWDAAIKIGNTIQNMRGVVRIEMAEDGLGLLRDLRKSGFTTYSEERHEIYERLVSRVRVRVNLAGKNE